MMPEKWGRSRPTPPTFSSGAPTAQSMLPSVSEPGSKKVTKLKFGAKIGAKWLAKRIDKRLNRYEKAGDGDVAGIILLGVLLTFILGILAIGGASALACSGNDVAAVLVVLLGAGLIALLWVSFVKWIRRVRAKAAANPGGG